MKAVAALVLIASCGPAVAPTPPSPRWLVIAPHPDDETLIASGIVRRAVEAKSDIDVIVMTNGDYDCIHDGLVRENESLAGLRALGLGPEHVHFLGYPDGGLPLLGERPLDAKRRIDGQCVVGNSTYGQGVGSKAHTRANAMADVAALIAKYRPTDIATTHPEDTHPDHAMTYFLVRDALDSLTKSSPAKRTPTVHRGLVHNGDCWPTGPAPHEPCPVATVAPTSEFPPLSGRLAGYVPDEHIPVPESCLVPDPAVNPKVRAIGAHRSQTRGLPDFYLFAFAKRDEIFFLEPRAKPILTERVLKRGETIELAGYAVTFDGKVAKLRAPEREWPLPHDVREAETFSLAVAQDAKVTEITLRMRGAIAGAAITVSPSARPAP